MMSEIRKEVNIRGLDPALGFLHSPYPGRESLILDIAEPLRPGVDAFVLNIIGELTPGHFTISGTDGFRISKEGGNFTISHGKSGKINGRYWI